MYRSKKIRYDVFPEQMKMLAEIATDLGFHVEWIDGWSGYLLKIEEKYFGFGKIPKFPLNDAMARALSRDKTYSYMMAENIGLKVPEGDYFLKNDEKYVQHWMGKSMDEALVYADEVGYPVYVKPNSLAMGKGCRMVFGKSDLVDQLGQIFQMDHIALIQKCVEGDEYRIVVLEGEIILVYQKKAPNIVGDGKKEVQQLVDEKNKTNNKLVVDWDLVRNLGYDKAKILEENKKLRINSNANLSMGGEIKEVVSVVPDVFKDYVAQVNRVFGLRLYGLDLIVGDLSVADSYIFLEINADPGFDGLIRYDRILAKEMIVKILKWSLKT